VKQLSKKYPLDLFHVQHFTTDPEGQRGTACIQFWKKQEGCLILTTCLSRESGDLSGATGTSCTSREVVNMRRFSETT